MGYIQAIIGEPIILHAFTKNLKGELVNQPANYPKITIDLVEDTGSTNIVAQTTMSKDVDGEYYYEWDTSALDPGFYKARYEAQIEGIDAVGFDEIEVKRQVDRYSGEGI